MFVRAFGREGTTPGFMRMPGGVGVDAQGNIYVAEIIGDRVQKFDPQGKSLRIWTGSAESGPLNEPSDVQVDHQNRVWVADRANNRILCFTTEGEYIDGLGSKTGLEFAAPNGLGLHPTEPMLYVADTYHDRIRVFDISGETALLIADYGTRGTQPGALFAPTDVAVSSRGEIHVTEPSLNRIQIFSSAGKFRLAMGTGGTRAGEFNNPIGIALDCNDDIYVVDTFNGRVQKFHRDGIWVYDWGTTTIKIERLNRPLRACITPQGNVYITDTPGNVLDVHRIVEFQLPPCITQVRKTTWSDIRRIFRSKKP